MYENDLDTETDNADGNNSCEWCWQRMNSVINKDGNDCRQPQLILSLSLSLSLSHGIPEAWMSWKKTPVFNTCVNRL